MNDLEFVVKMEEYINNLTPIKPHHRTIEEVVGIIKMMPYQFKIGETEKFISLLNENLDEILKIHKAEMEAINEEKIL